MKHLILVFSICMSILYLSIANAEPWFTGPLIITPGQVMPLGRNNLEMYFQNSNSYAIYDYDSDLVSIPRASSNSIFSKFTYGIASDVDFELDLLFLNNQTEGRTSQGLGDTQALLGFQFLRQGDSRTRPNLKVTLQELFPTGRFDQLQSGLFATDATGAGSYQTSLGLNFDFLSRLNDRHYLKTSAAVVGTYTSSTSLHGESIYGGSRLTDGRIKPGNVISLDLAAELTLTQNWVAVMEGFFLSQNASDFNGYLGKNPSSFDPLINNHHAKHHTKYNILEALRAHRIRPNRYNIGNFQDIGNGNETEISLAPALEYNFSENFGIMGSVWFTVHGTNTPSFFSSIFVINLLF